VDAGQIKVLLDQHRYSLADASDAHAAMQSGAARGKVVVEVA
jgi:NADPH:quinone reductase-like Zn-dependent oxidoreductase